MIRYSGTYTDQYQLTMAQVYFLQGKKSHMSVFDYFFRKLPFDGGYAIFAGLNDLISALEQLRFYDDDISFLKKLGFHPEFLNYLQSFRFTGNIYAVQEGDIIFPTRPVLTIEANIVEAQIIETIILNILNFQTLIATKARRIRSVARQTGLVDFGLRRAQGPGGYYASRAAIIGGFDSTSNVCAGRDFGIPVSGTMSHSFIQSYDNELQAFREFSAIWPDNCVLLVDTYDTLTIGVPNAICLAKELAEKGHKLKGIRLDSGDLAHLAIEARKMLNKEGLEYVKIAASNQLDEYVIQSLLDEQAAPIDIFGVGTNLVVGKPDAALDGVYKLAMSHNTPCIKLSESKSKITLPGKKQVYRLLNSDGTFWGADIVALEQETSFHTAYHPFKSQQTFSLDSFKREPLLVLQMKDGKRLHAPQSLSDIAKYSQQRLSLLPPAYKTLKNPKIYRIGLSEGLYKLREELIKQKKVKS